jgi:hypothetical protein
MAKKLEEVRAFCGTDNPSLICQSVRSENGLKQVYADGYANSATEAVGIGLALVYLPGALQHVFRNADGHLAEDTPANRQLFIIAGSNPSNRLGTDQWGNEWFAETRPDGTQVWVQVRNGKIIDAGVNKTVKSWDSSTGLKKP